MNREVHVPFCERLRGKFPQSTHHSCHYIIDWNYDEDRSRISKGNGPENMTRLRRFAVGVIKMFVKGKTSVTEKMQQLNRNIRLVFDYLRMTQNSTRGVTPSLKG